MKKLKIVLMSIVVIGAISGAFASKRTDFCEFNQQYYKVGYSYFPTGNLGQDYVCISGLPFICTYWRPNPVMEPNNYVPCRMGYYYALFL